MKKTFEIEWEGDVVNINVEAALRYYYGDINFKKLTVRELSAKQVDPMSGPIPIKTLALLDGLEELEL